MIILITVRLIMNNTKEQLLDSLNKIATELLTAINSTVDNEHSQPKHKVGDIVFIASSHGPLQLPIHSITHFHTKDGLEYQYAFEGYTSLPATEVYDTLNQLAHAQIQYWRQHLDMNGLCGNG
jgi:hypothetical protein